MVRAGEDARGDGALAADRRRGAVMDVRRVAFGRPAACALRDEIVRAKGGDLLTPVTVVVPRNLTGLAVRRLLASGDLGTPADGLVGAGPGGAPTPEGVVNVRFTTLPRLVEEVAGPALAAQGALPATSTVVHALARQTLGETDDHLLAPVRDHPGTVRSLVAAFDDLRGVSSDVRSRLAAGSMRAAGVVAMVERMEELLGDRWYDQGRRVEVAIDHLAGGWATPVGPVPAAVLVHLPLRLDSHHERFLAAVSRHCPVRVLVGVTGEPSADQGADELVARLARRSPAAVRSSGDEGAVPVGGLSPPVGTAVVSAPASDAEVRMVVRRVMERRCSGTPFERMAIVTAGPGPYERLVREALDGATVPWHGVGTRPLSATIAGRTLLRAFELDDRGWRRDEVLSWLAGAPILGEDRRPVPATAWDLVSRAAGVTSGLDGWRRHLRALVDDHHARLAELDGPAGVDAPGALTARLHREVGEARALGALVARLAERLAAAPAGWRGWAEWGSRFLDDLLGTPTERDEWPADEEEGLTAVRAALGRLAVLDDVGTTADRAAFRQSLATELDAPAPQTSRFGKGVLVGPVGLLHGLDLDVVFVVGMVDGAFPAREHEDPLLPDGERRAAGDEVPLRGGRRHAAHRDYLAALAAAPERVLSFARGDQRTGREQRPARWLLDTLGELEGKGRRLFSRDLADLGPIAGYEVVPSFTATVRAAGEPLSVADGDLRALLRWREAGRDLARHPLVAGAGAVVPSAAADDRGDEGTPGPGTGTGTGADGAVLRAGLAAGRARRSDRFTRFDGHIARLDVPSPVGAPPVSPTSLEAFAACPRRYLLERVLRVEARDRPEDILTLGAADRGTLVHGVLERFVARQLELPRDERIRPDVPWSPHDHDLLDVIAEQVFAEFEAQGLVGRRRLWALERARIVRDLHRFLTADDGYRREGGLVPERVELRFGPGGRRPVTWSVGGGRTVTFKGAIDRVDLGGDGSIAVVDYKTGSAKGFAELRHDPVLRGGKLQLPVYGLAARAELGDLPVRVAYWFVSERGAFERVELRLDPPVLARFGEAVATLVGSIEDGLFPARPGPKGAHCRVCPYDALCPKDRHQRWDGVRSAPELAGYVALVEDGPVASVPPGGPAVETAR